MVPTWTETEDRILTSLRARHGVATLGDVVADTGLPSDEVEESLTRLLRQYSSHLDVDEYGTLRYRFDPAFVRRGDTVAGRAWRRIRSAAARAFRWLVKGWIMVVLVGYSITFVVLLAIAAIAAMFSDDDAGGIAALPLYLLARVLETLFWIRLFDIDRRFGTRRRPRKKPVVPFYRRVFNFVLGPEAGSDPLAAQRRFAAFVRTHRGTVSAADWVAHSGCSVAAAETALTAAALRFRGAVDLTDDGVLLYRFDELAVSAAVDTASAGPRATGPASDDRNGAAVSKPIWERSAQPAPLTGNTWGWNLWIVTLNLFNLVMGSALISSPAALPGAALIGLGYMPVAFSLFFFAVPGVRLLNRLLRAGAGDREQVRRELIRDVFERAHPGVPLILPAPRSDADGDATQLSGKRVAAVLPQVVADLEAEPAPLDDAGANADAFHFDKVATALRAAATARKAGSDLAPSGAQAGRFGKTVFSSEQDASAWDEAELADFDRRLARELTASSRG